MPRSRVLTGMIDARSRATTRRRDRGEPAHAQDPVAALSEALDAMALDELALEEVERLDLGRFLRETNLLDAGPGERLRLLAIRLEAVVRAELPRAWLAVDRVYQEALRLAPGWGPTHESRGITAARFAELAGEPEVERRLFDRAHSSLQDAVELLGEDALLCYGIGHTCYLDRSRGAEEALAWFDRALTYEPSHPWSRLYRAHCLHDLERWEEAVRAYDEVPLGGFTGPSAWLVDLLKEQRAYCRLRAGDRERALVELEALLEIYEREPGRDRWMTLACLREAAAGPLSQELGARVRRLLGPAFDGGPPDDGG